MLRLATLLYSLVATTLAGSGVIVALVVGAGDASGIILAAVTGAVLAVPASLFIAKKITAP